MALALHVLAASSTPLPASAAIAGFGLTVDPIPADAPAALVSADSARQLAVDMAGDGSEISMQHGMIDAGPGIGMRSAWIFFFSGGDSSGVSWGPPGAGQPTVDYSGVVIDDQTGAVLRLLHAGHH
jgi:hypothetical protein